MKILITRNELKDSPSGPGTVPYEKTRIEFECSEKEFNELSSDDQHRLITMLANETQ